MTQKNVLLYVLICIALSFILLNFMSRRQIRFVELQYPADFRKLRDFSSRLNYTRSNESVSLKSNFQQSPKKLLLFWTANIKTDNFDGKKDELFNDCPTSNCLFTTNRTSINESAAVIFDSSWDINDLPSIRHNYQSYIYFDLDHPHPATDKLKYDVVRIMDFLNLTFTYRLDSDIIADNYLRNFRPKILRKREDFDYIWNKKSYDRAVSFHSTCEPSFASSYRVEYTFELNQYFSVDRYGDCGTLKCSNQSECDNVIAGYKFYLAFESSLCKDYVTDIITNAYNMDTVPIVLGGANYSAIFPKDSFIDVLDYGSSYELSLHLQHLSSNKDAYAKYFEWRYDPELVQLPKYLRPANVSFCKLCQLLNEKKLPRKAYFKLADWWSEEDCEAFNLVTWSAVIHSPDPYIIYAADTATPPP